MQEEEQQTVAYRSAFLGGKRFYREWGRNPQTRTINSTLLKENAED